MPDPPLTSSSSGKQPAQSSGSNALPRNRMRSNQAAVPVSPPLRSINEIRGSIPAGGSGTLKMDDEDGFDGAGGSGGGGSSSKVPAFLNKLFSMINDPKTDRLIYWSESGSSFFIPDNQDFGKQLLPQFFKHANFTSFVRQLNMYGFKKVPHLQTGTMNSFPHPPNELWEFTNPKFDRDHPEWLGSITRKKSAKEVAAAKALALQQHQGGSGGLGQRREDGGDVDMEMDGDGAGRAESSTAVHGGGGRADNDEGNQGDQQSLNKTVTLIKDTHSSMERQLAELKASNEMLWRQAMISREDQVKSQKKLDSIMRFLAGQFGNMNMAILNDEDGGNGEGSGTGRIGRLGKGRMIGDGVVGREGSDDDLMADGGEDDDLWEQGDDGDRRDVWEVNDSGEMIKVEQSRKSKLQTPARPNFNLPRPPTSTRKSQILLSPSKRFEQLDTSPEEPLVPSFETPIGITSDIGTPDTAQSVERLFPQRSNSNGNVLHQSHGQLQSANLEPNANNAIALHNPNVNANSISLDPSILNLSLGALLANPAGLQLLANLGQTAASFQNQLNAGNQASGMMAPGSPRSGSRYGSASRSQGQDDRQASQSQDQFMDYVPPAGQANGNWDLNAFASSSDTHAADNQFEASTGTTPFPSTSNPNPFSSSANAFETPSGMQQAMPVGDGQPTEPDDIDWSDPAIKALIESFDQNPDSLAEALNGLNNSHNDNANNTFSSGGVNGSGGMNGGGGIDPGMFTNDDQFDDLFDVAPLGDLSSPGTGGGTGNSTTTGETAQKGEGDLFAGPIRKKRKTDQRE